MPHHPDVDGLYFKLRYSRPVRRIHRAWSRLLRRLRFGPVPAAGWGHGWRVLVFRYTDRPRDELHVLAPVRGHEFDWESLRPYTRGLVPWPAYDHAPGKRIGAIGWAGHHTYVVTDGDPPQRLGMGPLVPGEFKGGVERSLLLVAVRPARRAAHCGYSVEGTG